METNLIGATAKSTTTTSAALSVAELWEKATETAVLFAELFAHPLLVSDDEFAGAKHEAEAARRNYLAVAGLDPDRPSKHDAEAKLDRLAWDHPEHCSICATIEEDHQAALAADAETEAEFQRLEAERRLRKLGNA